LEIEPNAIAIPTRAVLAGQQGSYVFVVGSDKLAKVRPISLGRAIGELTTIDEGLKPGEQVVVDGQSRLTPDAPVDVKNPGAVGGGRSTTTQAGAVR
jgi:multidrug efflux system membrane fusion protein